MQQDDVIWSVIDKGQCSYRLVSRTQKFCRNEYNATGLCSRQSCPLANSEYATVKEVDDELWLYMKVVERAAFPARLWERVRLHKNYARALEQINRHLVFWRPWIVNKVKLRFTRMRQYQVRKRRLGAQERTFTLHTIKQKEERRERGKEQKALQAARIEQAIEKELLERLKKGMYGDIYNFDTEAFNKVLEDQEAVLEEEMELEYDSEEAQSEFVVDETMTSSEGEDVEDSNLRLNVTSSQPKSADSSQPKTTDSGSNRGHRMKRKKRRVEVEYETESVPKQRLRVGEND